jgi:putative tryptophan/tyrosine transport system substrate-binding protein
MKIPRRKFITLLGSTAAWPLAARAQQPAMPVVGYLTSLRNDRPNIVDGFRRGLMEAGYIDGRDVTIAYRFAENQHDRLPALATDLVNRKVAVIVATGGGDSILAAMTATNTIPIVFTYGSDPVRDGFVASFSHPGGNVTGITFFNAALSAKGLGLLSELVPNADLVALLVNPTNPEFAALQQDAQEAAIALHRQLLVLNTSTPPEIERAFAALRERHAAALVVGGDAFLTSRRQQIVALAARDGVPALYFNRDFIVDGGLMSYGNDIPDAYRRAGLYAGRILKGERSADLPVDQATKFELVINLKTAKALGLDVPPTVLARADEVIE